MTEVGTDETLYAIYAAALDAMKSSGPAPLARRLRFEAEERDAEALVAPAVLIDYIAAATIGDRLLTKLRLALANWDADTLGAWHDGTGPRTIERRARIYDSLKLDDELAASFDRAMPVATDEAVIVSRDFEPWYGRVMGDRGPVYREHYADYLAQRGWNENSIAALDLNTTRIVERLAAPSASTPTRPRALSSAMSRAARPPISPESRPKRSTLATG